MTTMNTPGRLSAWLTPFPVVWEQLNKPSIPNKPPTADSPSCKLFAVSVLMNTNK